MLKIENRCCNCAVPGYPCLGRLCPNRNVEVHYCDECGREIGEMHELDGTELCEKCYLKKDLED